jgi:hypothetical protein
MLDSVPHLHPLGIDQPVAIESAQHDPVDPTASAGAAAEKTVTIVL